MIGAVLLPIAGVNNTGGVAGVLTLLLPLVLVPIVLAVWWVALRRRRE